MRFVLFALAATAALAAPVVPAPVCKGVPNEKPINMDAPAFVKAVPNGKLFTIANDNTTMYVAHVWGSPYDFGYAHGSLLKEQGNAIMTDFFTWIESQIDQYIPFMPVALRHALEIGGLDLVLDLTYEATKDYTPRRFFEEMRGLADALGVDPMKVIRVHMIPELVKAACTIVGGWGTATEDGHLVQVRALDWGTTGPLQKYPLLLVYHPEEGDGVPFSVLTWTGFLGALTGMSSRPIGMCEKVWDGYAGSTTRFGTPWNFVFRDVLQYALNLDDALERVMNANRTCAIFLGIGDGQSDRFVGVEYAETLIHAYDGPNYDNYPDGHPLIQDMMYWDKHVQPSHDMCLPTQLQKVHGNFTAPNVITHVTAMHETGDLHIAIFDHHQMHMYVSNAAPQPSSATAYNRAFTRFDMRALFNESRPTL